MPLDVRGFTMIGQFAKNALTSIPVTPISGQAYRNNTVTQQDMETGQAYDAIGKSELWNALLYMATGIAQLSEKFGFVPFSPLTNYVGDASWCMGQDGVPYRAMLDSGPGTANSPGVGPKPPPDTQYWESMADYISRIWGGGGGGVSSLVYPSAFYDFYEQVPPSGWMVRNGGLISSADTVVPKLWEELQKPENAWKLLTESDWQAQSQSSPWNGIGGVPKFVLDTSARTIRLPDTRGMYKEDAGFDGLDVGGVHGDAIRNIVGRLDTPGDYNLQNFEGIISGMSSGALVWSNWGTKNYTGDQGMSHSTARSIQLNASLSVPTANKNQPRAFGVLGCVYVGPLGN